MCILDHMQSTFFCLGKFLKKIADDQRSSTTKESIYCIKHMYIHPFSMEKVWPEIWRIMEVSTMFYICTYCIFILWGRLKEHYIFWTYLLNIVGHILNVIFVKHNVSLKIFHWNPCKNIVLNNIHNLVIISAQYRDFKILA